MNEEIIDQANILGIGTAIAFFLEFGLRAILVVTLLWRRRVQPETRVAWILMILALPLIGTILYLMIGEVRFGRTRINRHRRILMEVEADCAHASSVPGLAANHLLNRRDRQIANLAEQISSSGPVRGNDIQLLGDTDEAARLIIEDIDASKSTCHFIFYIWLDDKIGTAVGEALIRAAERGVTCRVLVDAVGSRGFLKSALCHQMRKGGVHVVAALPANPVRALFSRLDLRNHRKIIVIDGEIGWTGSQNMADAAFAPKPDFAPWVDCVIRMRGPILQELQILFIEDWYLDTDEFLADQLTSHCPEPEGEMIAQVVATGPNFMTTAATQLIQACIQSATAEITLTTPYFVPDSASILNLAVAARRGVKVELVVPKRNDSRLVGLASRGHYGILLEAGVDIHEFTGGLLHAKTICIDRSTALITSANLDRRSYNLNFEAGVIAYDNNLASQLRYLQQSYIEQSELVNPRTWHDRPGYRRLLENSAGLLSPLL